MVKKRVFFGFCEKLSSFFAKILARVIGMLKKVCLRLGCISSKIICAKMKILKTSKSSNVVSKNSVNIELILCYFSNFNSFYLKSNEN